MQRFIVWIFALFAGLAMAAPATAAEQAPAQVVQKIADELANSIGAHREELKKDHEKLIREIDAILLPHFDIEYASLLVLGRNARAASPEQRSRFAKAFYNSIAHRYAEGLLNYTRGNVRVLPFNGELNDKRTIVRTEVVLDDGKTVAVDYAFRKTSSRRMEGLRRDHRRHFLHHQLSQPGSRRNPGDQPRFADRASRDPGRKGAGKPGKEGRRVSDRFTLERRSDAEARVAGRIDVDNAAAALAARQATFRGDKPGWKSISRICRAPTA